MQEAPDDTVECGTACPQCKQGRLLVKTATPVWDKMSFSVVSYRCTECPIVFVLTKDNRFI